MRGNDTFARCSRRTLAIACLLVVTAPAAADAPLGIYALGPARDNVNTPQDERLTGIRNYDFVAGYTLRVFWTDIETAQGQYNFSVIGSAIQNAAAIGQGLSLEILTGEEPQYVLDGASSTYIDHRGGTNPVPWDTFAQQRQAALYSSLANYVVTGPNGPTPLSQSPTLKSIDAAPAGLNFGVRDLNNGIRNHPDYTQQRYVDAVVNGVGASANAFPNDQNFLAFFAFTDGQPGVRVDQQIIQRLAPLYNDPGQTKLAFFIENLSDDGPVPIPSGVGAGNNLLTWAGTGGDTMMQALDSWLVHAPDRDPQLDSRNPATGIQLGYETYGARFFELYTADLDGAFNGAVDAAGRSISNDLRSWNTILTSVPEPSALALLSIVTAPGLRRRRC
jgi:hypothetical protein